MIYQFPHRIFGRGGLDRIEFIVDIKVDATRQIMVQVCSPRSLAVLSARLIVALDDHTRYVKLVLLRYCAFHRSVVKICLCPAMHVPRDSIKELNV